MPETSYEIQVSFREGDRARLLTAVALDANGIRIPNVALHLEVDANGTFHIEEEHHTREVLTGSDGAVYFSWWPWPRYGPARNFISQITATWTHESARVYLEDLYE